MEYEYTVEVTNRFKGLDLVNSVREELRMKVHNTVQEAMNKTSPKKKKSKKAKWLSEEALQTDEERSEKKERKGKVHPTKCRVPKNSKETREPSSMKKKHFKIEEDNRRGKTRDFFRKIGNIKETFFPKMGTKRTEMVET